MLVLLLPAGLTSDQAGPAGIGLWWPGSTGSMPLKFGSPRHRGSLGELQLEAAGLRFGRGRAVLRAQGSQPEAEAEGPTSTRV
jgi:hypothetical protein